MSEKYTANPAYAYGQLERALRSAAGSRKAAGWQSVLAGMADGTLTIGSRTPVVDTPAWVTLEVAHGGFATGDYLAERPLTEAETAVVAGLPADAPGETDRERLNLWYLTDAGQATLLEAMSASTYRVEVPEDAALPVVAWLLARKRYEDALDLVATLRPWLHRLRMTPELGRRPALAGATVHVDTVGAVKESLRAVRVPAQLATMRDTITVWHPLYDRLVALWTDTVDGELPHLVDDRVEGGWPCRVWPADWAVRRAEWLADYERAVTIASDRRDQKDNFSRLRAALVTCEQGSAALTGRDVGWIRRALANTVTRHGAPDSTARTELRAQQRAELARPTHESLARVLVSRMDRYPDDGALPSLEAVLPEDTPPSLVAKASRALAAPVEELVTRKVITSGEVLAKVLPQITASLVAGGIEDPALSGLFAQTYAAFRRRRSLLLLNLEHQVGLDELPWIGVLAPLRVRRTGAARPALTQTVLLTLSAFPQTILPNPLVRELSALARQADVQVPLVEEVAADIFMGTFTDKWRTAAEAASRVLADTLYARYYDLPTTWVTRPGRVRRWGKRTADDFAALCASRAQEAGTGGGYVARNGVVLEQSQILTTHNLAALVAVLDLRDQLTALAPELADRALEWVARQQTRPSPHRHAKLTAIKNAAYAWRQAVFYLSFCDVAEQENLVSRCRERFEHPRLAHLRPAVEGLAAVVAGARFDAGGSIPGGPGRRLLGWSAGRHWAL